MSKKPPRWAIEGPFQAGLIVKAPEGQEECGLRMLAAMMRAIGLQVDLVRWPIRGRRSGTPPTRDEDISL